MREENACFVSFFPLRKFYTSDRSLLEGNKGIFKFVLQNSHLERLPFLKNYATSGAFPVLKDIGREKKNLE